MREILFRGQDIHGEWHIGLIAHIGNAWYISNKAGIATAYEVIQKTIGQYTGLKDNRGNKIFEGDIVKTRTSGTRIEKLKGYYGYDSDGYPQKIPGYDGVSEYSYSCEIDCYAKVEFNPTNGGFYLNGADKFVGAICNEIVGNIHDNPELMK